MIDLSNLSDKQREALENLRKKYYGSNSPIDEKDYIMATSMPLNDATFLRYLHARKWDTEKAISLLDGTISWRQKFGIQNMFTTWNDFLPFENGCGKVYVRGFDKQGHALIYMKPRNENSKNYDDQSRHVVYNLEKAIASMDYHTKQEKYSLIMDFHGYSISNAPPFKTSKDMLSIFQNYYPERLFRCYVVRPPWLFYAFYKLIYPFIDPITREKIVLIPEAKVSEVLGNEIDLDVLEADVCGKNPIPFDSAKYLKSPLYMDFHSIAVEELKKSDSTVSE